ncbi:MAG: Gfo/Idh/MocA family oxidoreductase [Candidatus Hydrogenedentes bacterium]|nr:Gfo/Idh/MocA family oxidoreductase [Candidatus Hydrogenedentota bacterium]
MDKVRIGVMGCANVAWKAMLPALLECHEARLVAVASRSGDKARRFAERFGCNAVAGYASLLERDDIDVIYMPLPTGLHDEWVRKALDAGKHLLVEKSFTSDLESAEALAALAAERGLLVMENFLFPLHSQHQWVSDRVSRGDLGDLWLFRSTFAFPPLPDDNFRYDPALGGGALLDAGGYPVKAAQLFLGDDLALTGAVLEYDSARGVDLAGHAQFVNGRGQVAQVSFGFNSFYQCRYELLGTKARLVVERAFTPPPGFRPQVRLEAQDHTQTFTLAADDHYLNMWRHFAATVRSGEGFDDHRRAVVRQAALLHAIRQESA